MCRRVAVAADHVMLGMGPAPFRANRYARCPDATSDTGGIVQPGFLGFCIKRSIPLNVRSSSRVWRGSPSVVGNVVGGIGHGRCLVGRRTVRPRHPQALQRLAGWSLRWTIGDGCDAYNKGTGTIVGFGTRHGASQILFIKRFWRTCGFLPVCMM